MRIGVWKNGTSRFGVRVDVGVSLSNRCSVLKDDDETSIVESAQKPLKEDEMNEEFS